MNQVNIIIGVLIVIVLVLLLQRTASPFRCEAGEIERSGKCESNSTKDRWWAFWESPKCKRGGELQADYTCLADMIMDAVSPGQAAASPNVAAAPTPAVSPMNTDQRVSEFVEANFFTPSSPIEYTINIGTSDACPIASGSKVQIALTPKQTIDQDTRNRFRELMNQTVDAELNASAESPEVKARLRNAGINAIQTISNDDTITEILLRTIDTQGRRINIAVCRNTPIRTDHIAADAVRESIKGAFGMRAEEARNASQGQDPKPQDEICKPKGFLTDRAAECCSKSNHFDVGRARFACN